MLGKNANYLLCLHTALSVTATILENSEHAFHLFNTNVSGMTPNGLFFGQISQKTEVAVLSSSFNPATGALQNSFEERTTGRVKTF